MEPKEIAEFREILKPREHKVFFGALDAGKLGFFHKLIYKLPVNRDDAILPQGDFRNWSDIDAWATAIAQALKAGGDQAARL
jgi:menaquinone-dependent protoporphyrinogen oxidase